LQAASTSHLFVLLQLSGLNVYKNFDKFKKKIKVHYMQGNKV